MNVRRTGGERRKWIRLPLAIPVFVRSRDDKPSAPLAALAALPNASRNLRAKAMRTTHAEGYHLLGLKFSRPLLNSTPVNGSRQRKLVTAK